MRLAASFLSLFLTAGPAGARAAEGPGPAIIGYVFARDRVLEPEAIAAEKLTHVNFAFANIRDGRVIEGSPRDADNLKC